ncbi:MAG TPA: peptidase S41, partial [Ramlibacter sp.]|nr:peptidase S41 [Ramlibacter sp.]
SGQGPDVKDPVREKAREEAIKRAEEEAKKPVAERSKVPEFGSEKDFQLVQALNQLKGRPVLVSKTQIVENKNEKKEN